MQVLDQVTINDADKAHVVWDSIVKGNKKGIE